MRRRVAVLALAWAGAAQADDARWYMQIDNDAAWGTDRWYTSGVRIAREHDGSEWGFVQEIYTPDSKNWEPGMVDRAPVGRLLATYARHIRAPQCFTTLELDLGVRGPAAGGRETTQTVHHVISAPHVEWSRQLQNAFDGQAIAVHTQSFAGNWKAHVGAVVGTQVMFAHVGLEYRGGANASVASPLLRFAATPPFGGKEEFGWSWFAGMSLRGVARNHLLGKNYDPFGPEISAKNAVMRGTVGLAYAQRWGEVEFSLASDSREFEEQHSPVRFGSLSFHVDF